MSPEERQLLAGLFERTKSAASAQRDQEAETFISEQIKTQPAAPYLLAQSVIVMEEALKGANERLQQLEARVKQLEAEAASKPAGGGFLGGLFGGAAPRQAPPPPPQGFNRPPAGPWGAPQAPQGGYAPQYAPPQAPAAGGGFLTGALGTAAGVAGGVLLAESIRGLFTHGGMGGMSNLGIGQGYEPAHETIINNYYGDAPDQGGGQDAGYDAGQDYGQDAQDADYGGDGGYDDGGFDSGGDSYDV